MPVVCGQLSETFNVAKRIRARTILGRAGNRRPKKPTPHRRYFGEGPAPFRQYSDRADILTLSSLRPVRGGGTFRSAINPTVIAESRDQRGLMGVGWGKREGEG